MFKRTKDQGPTSLRWQECLEQWTRFGLRFLGKHPDAVFSTPVQKNGSTISIAKKRPVGPITKDKEEEEEKKKGPSNPHKMRDKSNVKMWYKTLSKTSGCQGPASF